MNYDPLIAPDPARWLAADEQERMQSIRAFHQRARIQVPNMNLHVTLHAIIENQAAEESEAPTRAAIERLQREGLDRHDAVHAVASVLAENLFSIMQPGSQQPFDQERYVLELEALTAQGWLDSFQDE